jgi:hypothetical protein
VAQRRWHQSLWTYQCWLGRWSWRLA